MDAVNNKFVQIRLWKDCINNCSFCYLKSHNDRKTTLSQKIERLHKATELVKTLNAEKIGLIGGEFFEGQLDGCEDDWLDLLDALKNSNANIFITANLIHKQYMLDETVNHLEKKLLICTSYDTVGRFHTENDKQRWFDHTKTLHEIGVSMVCNCVATQDFFEEDPEFPSWLPITLVDPHISLEWLRSVDKSNYNNILLSECDFFNFPKRRTALDWFKKHSDVAGNYSDYTSRHSDIIYTFNEHGDFSFEITERLHGNDFNNNQCSHPWLGLCYADCDRCMICDAKRISDNFLNQ